MLLGFAAFSVLLHLATSAFTEYGAFIDELYYIACSKRLAFGYVDHPPFSIWLLALSRSLIGDSLPALRLLPSIAMGATVFLTGRMARNLGCGLFGQALAALAVMVAPVYLLIGGLYSMNPFELLIWTACASILFRILRGGDPRLWLGIGVLVGIGLEFKHTMALYVFAMLVGVRLSPAWRSMRTRHLWIGGAIAFAILLPNLIWQYAHGFPSLEFYRNAMVYKNIPTPPHAVIGQQILLMNPLALPLWLAGLWYGLFTNEGRPFRGFSFMLLILFAVMIASQSSRPDRIVAAYPPLFAMGGRSIRLLFLDRWRTRAAIVGLFAIAIGGIALAPLVVPVLTPKRLTGYMSAIGFRMEIERGKTTRLPQWFADRFGWKETAAEIVRVCEKLTPEERRHAVIFSGQYGQAGAIELYGAGHDLPPVICPHNSYYLWGPGPHPDSVRVFVTIMSKRENLEGNFEDIQLGGVRECEYCMDYERRLPIYIARGPKFNLREEWRLLKHYE